MSNRTMIVPDDNGRGAYIEHAIAATPSDSTTYTPSSGVYVGVSGNLAVTHPSGAVITYTNIPVGLHPISVTKVMATNTTATSIIVVY